MIKQNGSLLVWTPKQYLLRGSKLREDLAQHIAEGTATAKKMVAAGLITKSCSRKGCEHLLDADDISWGFAFCAPCRKGGASLMGSNGKAKPAPQVYHGVCVRCSKPFTTNNFRFKTCGDEVCVKEHQRHHHSRIKGWDKSERMCPYCNTGYIPKVKQQVKCLSKECDQKHKEATKVSRVYTPSKPKLFTDVKVAVNRACDERGLKAKNWKEQNEEKRNSAT